MSQIYYPDRENWVRKDPQSLQINNNLLLKAIEYSKDNENKLSIENMQMFTRTASDTKEPHDEVLGPVKERGDLTGLIIKNGYIIAEWGDPERVDMTFSVTKTFLSTTVGLAYDDGLIPDLNEKVYKFMDGEHFEDPHNQLITWDHLLRQTSEWKGNLWSKPDWADRPPSDIPFDKLDSQKYSDPGTKYKYNDVRVNLLALLTANVWKDSLPNILKSRVMDPIGASETWKWHGYTNSWIDINNKKIQSVSGGGHWGGGMFINAMDQARFGYLFLRNGIWDNNVIISKDWINKASSPGEINHSYGFMNWFLNSNLEGTEKQITNAPKNAVYFSGLGSNIIYIDWENDLVVVVRWIKSDALPGFIDLILKSIN